MHGETGRYDAVRSTQPLAARALTPTRLTAGPIGRAHQYLAARLAPPHSRLAKAEPEDLGRAIATATLDAARRVVNTCGLDLEVADPEPVLRGVASAYAAIASTLPGGLDEGWALLGLLALELEDAARQRRADVA